MRHRTRRQTGLAAHTGWLTVSLASVALFCFALAVAAPGSGPRAGAATARQQSESVALTPSVDPATSSTPISTAVPSTAVDPTTVAPTGLAAVAPVRISIPAIDLAARVDELGLKKDRTVQVPKDPMRAGWYLHGPTPGEAGSAVILGHVDSTAGTAVFARLRDLRPGDLIVVKAGDGTKSTFRVIRLATYPNDQFPAEKVYAAPGPDRRLNLVTCGGKYTRATGHQANLVVYTRLVQDA